MQIKLNRASNAVYAYVGRSRFWAFPLNPPNRNILSIKSVEFTWEKLRKLGNQIYKESIPNATTLLVCDLLHGTEFQAIIFTCYLELLGSSGCVKEMGSNGWALGGIQDLRCRGQPPIQFSHKFNPFFL